MAKKKPKRFGKERPDTVRSIEKMARLHEATKARRREAKRQARQAGEAAQQVGRPSATDESGQDVSDDE